MSRVSLSIISILFFFCAYSVAADGDILEEVQSMDIFKLRQSAMACPVPIVGQSCPEGNPLFYFKCCGDLNASCCFRLQDWLMALLVILAVFVVISLIINFIRCLFCY